MKHLLRQLPAIHELQKDGRFQALAEKHRTDQEHLTDIAKRAIEEIREEMISGSWEGPEPGTSHFDEALFIAISKQAEKKLSYTLKRVINATGTILHTNLGRARLSEHAIRHVVETARNYSNLEYKLAEGERGSRHSHVEAIIREITGAEAAMVVNNNAAAVYLVLRALAKDKEVIVSRGQLVEIGGSFRISSIMEESGAVLREIGTTNKTHLRDYEKAITEETAMILKVHTSNFKILGFTNSVETAELAELSRQHGKIVYYEDLGSGVLYDFRKHGIGEEPVVSEVLKMGADIVSFSGDKLLGGPQAGIIAGKKELIDQLKSHQLARVVRVDKMTLAALEGTLLDYLRGDIDMNSIPTIRDLLVPLIELKERTESLVKKLNDSGNGLRASLIQGTSQVGGGTMPDVELPTYIASVTHADFTAEQIARKLRTEMKPSIIVRIHREEIQIDLRTVTLEEEQLLLDSFKKLAR
ncbi:L-seryl-tRNA(Sec) selenium transferase [Bacillus sp. REN3]|uniref:L-seryl-tRNA(Sec) selenium transferase n=1 Tax=Bacillus sp. REN3 TaxID=2802440 RepID=UPI001AEDE9D9|nr:L-seryl-tRNA(Sec) selenium transferase [Bacillus sp. REN3]